MNPMPQTGAQNQSQQQASNQVMRLWPAQHQQLQHQPGQGQHAQQLQLQQPSLQGGASSEQARRRKLPTTAKAHPPPEGFYCYYPELFDKPNATIFQVVTLPHRRLRAAAKPPQPGPEGEEKAPPQEDGSSSNSQPTL